MEYNHGNDPRIADDNPDYGTFFSRGWDCNDWRIWYFSLKAKYGPDQARNVFNKAWEDLDFFGYNYSWCKYESDFHEFLKAENIDQSNIIADTTSTAKDVVEATNKIVHNVAEGATNLSGMLTWLPVVAVVVVGLIILVNVQKTVKA